jgi:AAA domain
MTTNPRMPGRVVEICGLPGSGKSHLARQLIRELDDRGVIAHLCGDRVSPDVPTPLRVSRKLGLVGADIATRPRSAVSITARIVTSGQRDRNDVLGRVIQWLGTQRLITTARRTAGVHIFDEGVIQALWSVGLRGDVSALLRWLESRRNWAAADLVVLVAAPLEVVQARLSARSSQHSRVQVQSAQERWAELARGQLLLDEIADWWTRTQDATRLLRWVNDGTHVGEAAVARLTEQLVSPHPGARSTD